VGGQKETWIINCQDTELPNSGNGLISTNVTMQDWKNGGGLNNK
jgi:hypothetical protein